MTFAASITPISMIVVLMKSETPAKTDANARLFAPEPAQGHQDRPGKLDSRSHQRQRGGEIQILPAIANIVVDFVRTSIRLRDRYRYATAQVAHWALPPRTLS